MTIDVKTKNTERENTKYVELGEIRLVITDGILIGWYRP